MTMGLGIIVMMNHLIGTEIGGGTIAGGMNFRV